MTQCLRYVLALTALGGLASCGGSDPIIQMPSFAEMDADLSALNAAAASAGAASALPSGSVAYSGNVGFSWSTNVPAEIVDDPDALGLVDLSLPFAGNGAFSGYVGNVRAADGSAFPSQFVMTGTQNGTELTATLNDGGDTPYVLSMTGSLRGAGATYATLAGSGGQGSDPLYAYMVLARE